jgi:YebC/PmpR family DNA-binding regulatory protein
MSGHNKWSKIKHKKAIEDAKKSKEFSRHAQLITLASREAKGDTSSAVLQAVIKRAKAVNMPGANIERAVKRGTEKGADTLEEVCYEAYGPGGIALIISGLTDNKNRTFAEVRHVLTKYSASPAAQGAALWAFEKTDDGWKPKTKTSVVDEDKEKLLALKEELEQNNDIGHVYSNAENAQ